MSYAPTIEKKPPILKIILYIAIALIILYYSILIFTSKPQVTLEFQRRLDSLTLVTTQLQHQQKFYDSIISTSELKVKQLDERLDSIKEKTIIIKEYYHEKSTAADSYTNTQLDSFFAKRYGY